MKNERMAQELSRAETRLGWGIIALAKAIVTGESFAGVDDNYNQSCQQVAGYRMIGEAGHTRPGFSIFLEKAQEVWAEGRCDTIKEVAVLKGGCGYGSRAEGWFTEAEGYVRLQSCGGHWVSLSLEGNGGWHVTWDCDEVPSTASWGDCEDGLTPDKIREARIASIMAIA